MIKFMYEIHYIGRKVYYYYVENGWSTGKTCNQKDVYEMYDLVHNEFEDDTTMTGKLQSRLQYLAYCCKDICDSGDSWLSGGVD